MDRRDLFVLLLMLLFYFSQRETDMTGHWHLTRIDEEGGYSRFDTNSTLDVEKDSTVILGKYLGGYGGFNGKMFDDGHLWIGPTCFVFSGKYEFKNGKLYIYEKRHEEKDAVWVGTKRDPNLCNKQKAFFYDEKVAIDLPILTSGMTEVEMETSLAVRFYFGIPKREFQEEFGIWSRMQSTYQIEGIDDFELVEEKHRIKVVESKRDRMYITIYADKETPLFILYPLIEYYRKNSKMKVYLASRSTNKFIDMKIFYTEIDINNEAFTAENTQLLEDWLVVQNKIIQ